MKKIISIMLAVVMMISFMTPAMASSKQTAAESIPVASEPKEDSKTEPDQDSGLEKAIKAVKSKIAIPDSLKKFSYNISEQNGLKVWYLSWNDDETNTYMSATVDENNFISRYSSYEYRIDYIGKQIPKYSKEQGQKIAEDFVNKLDPGLLKQYKKVENNESYYSRDYSYYYVRQVNGINYFSNTISINVNSMTGEVSNYNCSYSPKTTFEDSSKVIGLEKAQQAFAEKLGLKLVYNVKRENNKNSAYLAYVPKTPEKYIDAITGEVVSPYDTDSIRNVFTGSEMAQKQALMDAAGETGGIVLTPDELEAVKNMSDLLKKEDADKKVRAISQLNIDSEFQLTSSQLRKNWRNEDAFTWTLQYVKVLDEKTNKRHEVNVSVNAKTGEIISFWAYYESPEGAKPKYTEKEARAIADSALKQLIPNTYSKLKAVESNTNPVVPVDEKSQSSFSFGYVRMEKGIEVTSDYYTISYDNLSGKISNLYSNWTDGLKFDDPKKAISVEKANETLFNKIGYGIQYVDDYSSVNQNSKIILPENSSAKKAVLGYFIDNGKPSVISGLTGEILDYNGAVYVESKNFEYTDITGLEAENQIRILTQMDIRYLENELKAKDNLLQKDYFILLCKLTDQYYYGGDEDADTAIERMYSALIGQGIITKEEKAPASTLTREEAAKYLVKFLNLGQVAQIKDIFKLNFKDADKVSPDMIGYVAIASGLKAMNGSGGNFYPQKKITRLEGLLTIYNYLSAK